MNFNTNRNRAAAVKKVEKILNTTERLFLRSGVRKITMDDIAESAGVSKVTIYKYFEDKDTLYHAISRNIFSRSAQLLENVLSSEEIYIKKLYDYMEAICSFTDSGQYDLCRELSRYNHEAALEYDLYLQVYKRTMMALIDEGIKNGMMKNGLDRDSIFYYIDMGMIYYQKNRGYRDKMRSDDIFRQRFLLFYIGNIFSDAPDLLTFQ